METLGVWLHQARESKGVTLKEAEAATRIRARFLELLEAGDFAAFPGGEVQIRGFLRIYARYLGLSPEEAVARYEVETRSPGAVPAGALSQEASSAPPVRSDVASVVPEPRIAFGPPITSPSHLSVETVMIVGIVLIVLLMIVTAVAYFIGYQAEREAATEGAPAQATLPAMRAPATPVSLTPTFPVNPGGGVTLTLKAGEHVWVRVSVDGVVAFVGILAPGEMTWSGREAIVVETGNGAALQVTVNGQVQGKMCGRNQVCTRAWGPTGELVATPPASATAP